MVKRDKKRPSHGYTRVLTTETHDVDNVTVELYRITVSKVSLEPGTSSIVAVQPVSQPMPPVPIAHSGILPKGSPKPSKRRTRWPKERDYIVAAHHRFKPPKSEINSIASKVDIIQYCLPVTIPANLEYGLAHCCFVWLGTLDGGGYARAMGKKIHRLTFEHSRETTLDEKDQVYHLCQRPYCVQPGHLYTGHTTQNALDRDVSRGKFAPDFPASPTKFVDQLLESAHNIVQAQGKPLLEYHAQMTAISLKSASLAWRPLEEQQMSFDLLEYELPLKCPGHEFRVRTLREWVCSICGVFQSDA